MFKSLMRLFEVATLALLMAAPVLAQAPEVKTLSIGFGIDPPFAPAIVAIEKGWFKQAGFTDVKTPTFNAGALAGEALVAGEINLWIPGNLPPIAMVHNSVPIVIVGNLTTANGLTKLIARKDAKIERPEDLIGKKIGVFEGSTQSAWLAEFAKHYHLDMSKLKVVNLQPPEEVTSLLNNDVQAIVIWEPWALRALHNGKVDTVLLHTGNESFFPQNRGEKVIVEHTMSVIVASQKFVRENPNAIKAAVSTLMRAADYVSDPKHRDEVIQMFAKYQKQDPKLVADIWHNYVFDTKFDKNYVDNMEAMASYLESAGRIKNRRAVLDYTDTDIVQAYDPSRVNVKGRWKP